MTLYAVGDLHGNLPEFQRAVALIEADGGPGAEVVWLGDYADRGPETRGVIDGLIAGQAAGRRWHCLLGNHDRLFLRFLSLGTLHDAPMLRPGASWFHPGLGGLATLASYGIVPRRPVRLQLDAKGFQQMEAFETREGPLSLPQLAAWAAEVVPAEHRLFLERLKLSHETDRLFFAHAGVRPGVPLSAQVEDDLVWIRAPFLDDMSDHGKLVVHGHTPVDVPEHRGNRVALDTGAGYGHPVSVGVFDQDGVFVLTEAGRARLPAP